MYWRNMKVVENIGSARPDTEGIEKTTKAAVLLIHTRVARSAASKRQVTIGESRCGSTGPSTEVWGCH
jgi:hypothetical protein